MNQLAQSLTLPGGGAVQGPVTGATTIGDVISNALPIVFAFAGAGLFLMLMAAGFSYLTSAGDAKKLEQGKQRLTYALIGFAVIFASFWAVQAAGIIFGLPSMQGLFQ